MEPEVGRRARLTQQGRRRRQAVGIEVGAELDAIGTGRGRGGDAVQRLAADLDQQPVLAQIAADTQTPPCRLDSTAASMNLTPRTPSSTVGVSKAPGSGVRPSIAAQICSAASA